VKQFSIWVRISATQTTHTVVFACDALTAKLLAEKMYGIGNVLNYTEIKE
jgi:hypothetical protein